MSIDFEFNDGGRAASGFRGTAGDCAARAIAIATETPYSEVYDAINALAQHERVGRRKGKKSSARNGVFGPTVKKYMSAIGWKWTPTMGIGSGCTVHLRKDELPMGRLVVLVSRHYVAVIDGAINDLFDCSRNGTRCVYGYFSRPGEVR